MEPEKEIEKVSREEILFLRDKAPRGMWKMVEIRTGRTREQVLYQIKQMPDKQDLVVLNAAREILKAITGEVFEK